MSIAISTLSPLAFESYIQKNIIIHNYYQTNAGILKVFSINEEIYKAEFCDVPDHLSIKNITLLESFNLLLVGTNFQIKVWKALLQTSENKTISYQELATIIDHPNSWRAVANVMAHNKIAFFIPCHKVIRKNGSLGGYKWGLERKKLLLAVK
ncbi:MAG: MGMT family protein [Candidatus Babeliales bacterium]